MGLPRLALASLLSLSASVFACASQRDAIYSTGDCIELQQPVPLACGNATVGGVMHVSVICQADRPDRWIVKTTSGQTFTWVGAECLTVLPGAF